MIMVMHPVVNDCANLRSGAVESRGLYDVGSRSLLCPVDSVRVYTNPIRRRLWERVVRTLVRPWLTSLFHTAATCLAKCTSCSTKADRANEIPPQSPIASSLAILANPVPSNSEGRATS